MTIHITNRKGNKLQLNGDILSGETFAIKEYIKSKLDGKWIADRKAWRVDVAKVNRWLAIPGAEIFIDKQPVTESKSTGAAFPKNMTYTEFARRMDSSNSDW